MTERGNTAYRYNVFTANKAQAALHFAAMKLQCAICLVTISPRMEEEESGRVLYDI